MGNNTLSTVIGGIGRPTQVNQYKEALSGDILPRNVDGEVETNAAGLGSATVEFDHLFVKDLFVSGFNGTSGTVYSQTFLTSGTFLIPEKAFDVVIFAVGGGGAAGSYAERSSSFYCGGGGGGGGVAMFKPAVIGGETISITIGASCVISGAGWSVTASQGSPGVSATGVTIRTGTGGAGGSVSFSNILLSQFVVAQKGGSGGSGGYYSGSYIISGGIGESGILAGYGAGGNGGHFTSTPDATAGLGFSGSSAGAVVFWRL